MSLGWYDTVDAVYTAMEFAPLGDLYSHMRQPFSEIEVRTIFRQGLSNLGSSLWT
jgi:hypothetical protein